MHPSEKSLLREVEVDHQYNFQGATLKISEEEQSQNILRQRNNTSEMDTSAILTGSDVTSPIHVASGYKEIKSTPVGENPLMCGPGDMRCPKSEQIPVTDEFFCFRPGQVDKAVENCVETILKPANDMEVIGRWLLTEVSHWDHERERVYILTTKSLVIAKYDFIALRILQSRRVRLDQIDTIIRGKLTYPAISLIPRIEGIANGLTSLICGQILCQQRPSSPAQTQSTIPTNPLAVANRFDFSCFRPIERSALGIRIMWNKCRPISLLSSWNPFANDIPWTTVKDHPILSHKNNEHLTVLAREQFNANKHTYSMESFYEVLSSIFSNANPDGITFSCDFREGPILMENYVAVGAVIHNKHDFGFFKVRGKFGF